MDSRLWRGKIDDDGMSPLLCSSVVLSSSNLMGSYSPYSGFPENFTDRKMYIILSRRHRWRGEGNTDIFHRKYISIQHFIGASVDWNPFERFFFSFINLIPNLHSQDWMRKCPWPAASQTPRLAMRREACANLMMPTWNITTTAPGPSGQRFATAW